MEEPAKVFSLKGESGSKKKSEDGDLSNISSSKNLVESDRKPASRDRVPFIKRTDKFVFVVGVLNLILLVYMTAGIQWLLPYYYTVTIIPLIIVRYVTYIKGKRYAYFILDFCYWANISLLIYLWAAPYLNEAGVGKHAFAIIYAITFGPLPWAIIIFRNAMVFHSLDKIISVFIHITPMLVTFSIRWHAPVSHNATHVANNPRLQIWEEYWNGLGRFNVCELNDSCWTEQWAYLFYLAPAIAFIVWDIFYVLATRVCCPIPENAVDAFRYLSKKIKPLYFLRDMKNQKLAYFLYNLINIGMNIFMCVPGPLLYWNYYINLIFVLLVFICCIWNGGDFYIEVFAKRYQEQVKSRSKERAERIEKLRSRSASPRSRALQLRSRSRNEIAKNKVAPSADIPTC